MTDVKTHLELAQGVATITLDSPANRNALSRQLVTELREHLEAVGADPSVRAVVLTHTGNTFCAGADLAEARAGDSSATNGLFELLKLIVELPKPVVAKLDGHARAGGLGLLGAADIAIAGPRSTFAFTESALGLAPAIISLTTLPRMTERAGARYFLSAETFDAAEAERIGLITQAASDVDAATEVLLDRFRAASPQGLAESKLLATAGVYRLLSTHGGMVMELSARLFESAEAQEGMAAFLEKRAPLWAL